MADNNLLKEVKRKLIHVSGIFVVILLMYLPENLRLRVFAVLVLAALGLHWYWDRRSLRHKYIAQMAADIPDPHRHDILKGAGQIKAFEEEVIFGFMKDVTRKKEKDPMLATFYYLLSAFLALVLFGMPYAIFGIFAVAIGDSAAALVGKYFGKHKIFWNREKSIEGWIGFFAATSFSILIFLNFFPQFAVFRPLEIAMFAGIGGALIETIPTFNDNMTLPIGVSAVIWIFSLALV